MEPPVRQWAKEVRPVHACRLVTIGSLSVSCMLKANSKVINGQAQRKALTWFLKYVRT